MSLPDTVKNDLAVGWRKVLELIHEPSASAAKDDAIKAFHKLIDGIVKYAPEAEAIAGAVGNTAAVAAIKEAETIATTTQVVVDDSKPLSDRIEAAKQVVDEVKSVTADAPK